MISGGDSAEREQGLEGAWPEKGKEKGGERGLGHSEKGARRLRWGRNGVHRS